MNHLHTGIDPAAISRLLIPEMPSMDLKCLSSEFSQVIEYDFMSMLEPDRLFFARGVRYFNIPYPVLYGEPAARSL